MSVKTEQASDVHYCLWPRSCGAFALLRLGILDGAERRKPVRSPRRVNSG
jgi:hypothetical protein